MQHILFTYFENCIHVYCIYIISTLLSFHSTSLPMFLHYLLNSQHLLSLFYTFTHTHTQSTENFQYCSYVHVFRIDILELEKSSGNQDIEQYSQFISHPLLVAFHLGVRPYDASPIHIRMASGCNQSYRSIGQVVYWCLYNLGLVIQHQQRFFIGLMKKQISCQLQSHNWSNVDK